MTALGGGGEGVHPRPPTPLSKPSCLSACWDTHNPHPTVNRMTDTSKNITFASRSVIIRCACVFVGVGLGEGGEPAEEAMGDRQDHRADVARPAGGGEAGVHGRVRGREGKNRKHVRYVTPPGGEAHIIMAGTGHSFCRYTEDALVICGAEIFRVHLHQSSASTLLQLCDDASDSVLIENNAVTQELGCNAFSGGTYFQWERGCWHHRRVVAVLTLRLGVNGPLRCIYTTLQETKTKSECENEIESLLNRFLDHSKYCSCRLSAKNKINAPSSCIYTDQKRVRQRHGL